MNHELHLDNNGFPMLLAQAPPESVIHSTIPKGVDPAEWMRRQDAIRSAAQELEPMQHGDVVDHLRGVTTRDLSNEEIDQFTQDVRASKLDHVVDWMDGKLRKGSLLGLRGRRKVRVVPPKGWAQRTLANLTDSEVNNVIDRLEARGHNRDEISNNLISRFSTARQAQLRASGTKDSQEQ